MVTSAVPISGNNAVGSPVLDIFVRGWVPQQGVYSSEYFSRKNFPFTLFLLALESESAFQR